MTIALDKSVDFSFMLSHFISFYSFNLYYFYNLFILQMFLVHSFDEYRLVIAEQNKAGEVTLSNAFDSAQD